jgi:hypothetical protein
MPDPESHRPQFRLLNLRIATILAAVLVALLAVHWVERLEAWYFLLVAVAAVIFAASSRTEVPGLRGLSRLEHTDRLVVWIVLAALGVIGYLQNLITWVPDGRFFRPSDISIWKAELVMVMALTGPFVHWWLSRILKLLPPVTSRRLAEEFALYVNFSGIAMVLWTGDAGISLSSLAAATVLIVLAELTLHASQ